MDTIFGWIFTIGIIIAGILAFNGSFFVTGTEWYEACWEKSNKQKSAFDKEPVAEDPYEAVIWANCEAEAQRGIYETGMMFSSRPRDASDAAGYALVQACPSNWTDVPLGGSYLLVLKLLQEQGGPRFWDRFLPANRMIGQVMTRRWPGCKAERVRQGYPRIIETAPGQFQWEKPCKRCEQPKAG